MHWVLPQTLVPLVPRMHLSPPLDFRTLLAQGPQTPPLLVQVRQIHQRRWQVREPLQRHLSPPLEGHQINRLWEQVRGLQNHR